MRHIVYPKIKFLKMLTWDYPTDVAQFLIGPWLLFFYKNHEVQNEGNIKFRKINRRKRISVF